jgi:hypothetical protein
MSSYAIIRFHVMPKIDVVSQFLMQQLYHAMHAI